MQPFEYTGVWWVPAAQERQVAGTITFIDSNQIVLSLNGLLEPVTPHERVTQLNAYSIILGRTSEGQAITLVDCREIKRVSSLIDDMGGKQQHTASIGYFGAHFHSIEEIRFQEMDIHYSHLAQWAGLFPFLGYQHPLDTITATTEQGKIAVRSVSAIIGPDFIQERDFLSEELLPEAVCFHVEAARSLSLQEWEDLFITPLQNFLTLATQRANTTTRLRAYQLLSHNEMQSSLGNIEPIVQIIYPEARQITGPLDTVTPDTLFFSLNDITDRFSQVMDTWLKIEEELDSVSDLYFGVQYSKLYLNQRFLFIAQAAESLQSRRVERLDHTEEEHQYLISLLVRACPDQYKEWLSETLEHSNKTPFRKKLKRLYDSTKVILSPLIGNKGKDRDAFADRVYNTRNYLTHYDKTLKLKAARGDELFFLMQYLTIAIQTSLLYELGFTPEQCVQMFEKSRLYQFLLKQQKYRNV